MEFLDKWLFADLVSIGADGVFLYFLIALLMVLNSSVMVPSSELVCLSIGVLASRGDVGIVPSIIIATTSNFLGTLPWYFLGRLHIEERVHLADSLSLNSPVENNIRAKVVSLYLRDLRKVELLFKKYGWVLVAVLRNVPIIRSICSYPAGRVPIKFTVFSLASLLGISVWVSIWIVVGFMMGELAREWHLIVALLIGVMAIMLLKFVSGRIGSSTIGNS